mgnify:CR=1 FL=1
MHLHVIWDAIKGSRLVQTGVILIVLSGMAEALDQLGTVDLSAVPYLGSYSPAILATAGVAKVLLRFIVLIITAYSPQEPAE